MLCHLLYKIRITVKKILLCNYLRKQMTTEKKSYSNIFPNINFNVRLQRQISVEYADRSLFPNSKCTRIK
jgi:hypothetical protein